ncbi:c-type cytochrome [Variovorax sp. J22R24]|uniref:c-type cytochrome n=1 Tax=Variovorax gracilis TaxID=3053502 RepID=UPI002576A8AE|nr:c-type cytochrome [Variovorax sp. J22R24]MDM0108871.1 c-type cytochrome [Variovorax sp. J22R24]
MVDSPHRRVAPAAWLAWGALAVLACGCDLRERAPPHADADASQAERGRQLLAQYQCGSCHTIPRVAAAQAQSGPSLAAFGRRSYIAGHLPNQPETLAQWIIEPAALVRATAMPAMGVSARDARDMAAYLMTLE